MRALVRCRGLMHHVLWDVGFMLHFVHDLFANPTSRVAVTIGFRSRPQQNTLVPELLL